ncbi:helix-turn-helix transcriptional regulator [Sporosarcina sp. P20a]|uniref:helix-turn-helix domain-containing protein n=1 Tax=Sporosarcina sp. P20a TaxID=2048256 RepID=UPI001304632B|nr:helix-turn-helix transcriptional regulator [Sporosarcina sp. P20a]
MSEIKIVLDQVLKSRNISVNELARITGIRYETVYNLANGKVERVSLPHLARIMAALELTAITNVLIYEAAALPEDPLDDPIELLDLPPAVFYPLRRCYYQKTDTIRDLLGADLKKVPGIGPKHRETIRLALEKYRS